MTSRRQVLHTALALGLAPSLPLQAADTQRFSLDPLDAFTSLRAAPAGRPIWWHFSGHILGRLQGEPLRPLLSIRGANRSHIVRQGDGSLIYSMIEAGYYGEPDASDIIDGAMLNLLTGQPMKPQHFIEPLSLRFRPDLVVLPEIKALPPGMDFKGRLTAPDVRGGRVWMAEELFVKLPAAPGSPPILLNSLANFEASAADMKAGGEFVASTMQYTTVNSFRPWMNMGMKAGDLCMRLNAIKLSTWAQVPPALRQRIQADHGKALDG